MAVVAAVAAAVAAGYTVPASLAFGSPVGLRMVVALVDVILVGIAVRRAVTLANNRNRLEHSATPMLTNAIVAGAYGSV